MDRNHQREPICEQVYRESLLSSDVKSVMECLGGSSPSTCANLISAGLTIVILPNGQNGSPHQEASNKHRLLFSSKDVGLEAAIIERVMWSPVYRKMLSTVTVGNDVARGK